MKLTAEATTTTQFAALLRKAADEIEAGYIGGDLDGCDWDFYPDEEAA